MKSCPPFLQSGVWSSPSATLLGPTDGESALSENIYLLYEPTIFVQSLRLEFLTRKWHRTSRFWFFLPNGKNRNFNALADDGIGKAVAAVKSKRMTGTYFQKKSGKTKGWRFHIQKINEEGNQIFGGIQTKVDSWDQ